MSKQEKLSEEDLSVQNSLVGILTNEDDETQKDDFNFIVNVLQTNNATRNIKLSVQIFQKVPTIASISFRMTFDAAFIVVY